MTRSIRLTISVIALFYAIMPLVAQTDRDIYSQWTSEVTEQNDNDSIYEIIIEKRYETLLDSLIDNVPDTKHLVCTTPLPRYFYRPLVYTSYIFPDNTKKFDPFAPIFSDNESLNWLEDAIALQGKMQRMRQDAMFADPSSVKYNAATMSTPPKEYTAVVNPFAHTIDLVEKVPTDLTNVETAAQKINYIHWLHSFNGSIQFSQAYVSPNWYQGGNNNVNAISNFRYDIKLNQKLHPELLFDTSIQYKLAMNSAPEDTIRGYNISEDLFQFNSTFGLKAIKKWYYTVNVVFKTQLLNSYKSNTHDLRSALLSPGELNAGVGMTYNTANKKKTFTFDASISPISYNLMICTSDKINHAQFNIPADRKVSNKYGSSGEVKIYWEVSPNIKLRTRLFAFTDYDRFYSDLENTLVFEINKYLTTQIFAHLRYDTLTPHVEEGWHKLQVKEILSFGFAYKFSTI